MYSLGYSIILDELSINILINYLIIYTHSLLYLYYYDSIMMVNRKFIKFIYSKYLI